MWEVQLCRVSVGKGNAPFNQKDLQQRIRRVFILGLCCASKLAPLSQGYLREISDSAWIIKYFRSDAESYFKLLSILTSKQDVNTSEG